jgi:hypothetical protein
MPLAVKINQSREDSREKKISGNSAVESGAETADQEWAIGFGLHSDQADDMHRRQTRGRETKSWSDNDEDPGRHSEAMTDSTEATRKQKRTRHLMRRKRDQRHASSAR